MDFKDEINLIGERIVKVKEQINMEEATKNTFIMALGYDVFKTLDFES